MKPMARAPLQTLVILHRRRVDRFREFAVFLRADSDVWQFVSGGAEEEESPEQAARRELLEETGISPSLPFRRLAAVAAIPREAFPGVTHWPSTIVVIPEHAFAVEADDHAVVLSAEHREVLWLSLEDALGLLTWESNRAALRELHERLRAES